MGVVAVPPSPLALLPSLPNHESTVELRVVGLARDGYVHTSTHAYPPSWVQ
jgi:hypothetical protein